jgi:hypothetical protein
LLSDVGQNEPKKEIKRRLTAGLDKVGFIEAQALAGFSLGYPKKRVSPKGAKKSEQFLTAEAQNTRIPFCNS